MRQNKGTQLNCFSPPVMIATFVVEFCLAIYSIWRYKLNSAARLAIAMLVGLATFQLAEYFVCTGPGARAIPWSRLGFVAITTLPPLGLHLMYVLAKKTGRLVVYSVYALMLGFIIYFLTARMAFVGHECTGNYVIFQFSQHVTGTYSVYYYGILILSIALGFQWVEELRVKGREFIRQLQAVQGLILGYFIFLVPTGLAMTFKPETRRGIPSVMCGFAVLLALILGFYILPRAGKLKRKALTKS